MTASKKKRDRNIISGPKKVKLSVKKPIITVGQIQNGGKFQPPLDGPLTNLCKQYEILV